MSLSAITGWKVAAPKLAALHRGLQATSFSGTDVTSPPLSGWPFIEAPEPVGETNRIPSRRL
jgi:hypothetical protein